MKQQHIKSRLDHGFVMPQDAELESAVLGAVLLNKEAFKNIENILETEDFYLEPNQLIFENISAMAKANKGIDMLTVIRQMQDNGTLEGVGGPVYISELTSNVASDAHLIYHAEIIKELAVKRKAITLAREAINTIFEGEDIADSLAKFGKNIDGLQERLVGEMQGSHISVPISKAVDEMHNRVALARTGVRSGIGTGLLGHDKITNGWQKGDLVVIGARPAMGKTALALSFAKAAASEGTPVAIFSLEMSDISLANRLLLSECNVEPDRFKSGYLTSDEITAIERAGVEIRKLPIYVDDNASVTMNYIKSRSRMLHKQGRCGMIIVDYLQLTGSEKGSFSREQEVSSMSRNAKMIAKELCVPFLLLSQLNRGNESRPDKKPLLSDLRESGAIEQDADIVELIHRPSYYDIPVTDQSNNIIKNYGEIIIAKHRNGATGTVPFIHNHGMNKFFDYKEGRSYDLGIERGSSHSVTSQDNAPF